MGKLHHFLGVKIVYLKDRKIWIGQQIYAADILKKFQMQNSKPVSTPTEPGTKFLAGDYDWAGDYDDRKSTTGYVVKMSGAAISWRSKKQSCVALCTAEAEYMALAVTAQEAAWLQRLVNKTCEKRLKQW